MIPVLCLYPLNDRRRRRRRRRKRRQRQRRSRRRQRRRRRRRRFKGKLHLVDYASFFMHFRGCSISDFLEMKLLLHVFFWPRLKVIHCSHLLMEQLLRSRGSRPSTNNTMFFLYCQSYHYQHYLHLTLSCHSLISGNWFCLFYCYIVQITF